MFLTRLARRVTTRWARWKHGDTRTWRQALILAETRIRVERANADRDGWKPPDMANPTIRRILKGRGRDMRAIVTGKAKA